MKVTLQCCVCQTRATFGAIQTQLVELKDLGASRFQCAKCNRATYFAYPSTGHLPGIDRRVFSTMDSHPVPPPVPPPPPPVAAPPPEGPSGDAPPPGRATSRGPRRVALELPLRIRTFGLDMMQEITTTTNVSRSGFYFLSDKPYQVGQELRVALNYSTANEPLEQRAQVVRIALVPNNSKRGFGVKYL